MSKKIFSILLMVSLVFTATFSISAETIYTVDEKAVTVTYNGDLVLFPDAEPLIENGRTLVPARAIMERAHLTVSFDAETRVVVAEKDGFKVTMPIDSTSATVTKAGETKTVTLDVPATIIDDRTYVPVRFIAESLGTKVNWNPYYREVVIIDVNEWKQEIAENSEFVAMLLNLPIKQESQVSETAFTSSMLFTVENELVPGSKMSADISVNYTASQVYDGKNTGSNTVLEINLAELMNLFTTEDDKNEASVFAKNYSIDLDLIIDADWNLYIKSDGITALLRDLGQNEMALKIKGRYVTVSLKELLSSFLHLQSDLDELLQNSETVGDLFEYVIFADDMLYSASVEMIDAYVTQYSELYHNSYFEKKEMDDGSTHWIYTLDANDSLSAHRNDTSASGSQMNAKSTMEFITKDNRFLRSESIATMDMTEENVLHPEEKTTMKMEAGSVATAREFNPAIDKPIRIPSNTVKLDDVLGFSLADYITYILIS